MKKAVFLALIVCGLVASFLVGNSLSQGPVKSGQAQFDGPFHESQGEPVEIPDVDVDVRAEPFVRPPSEADKLRQEIMQLIQQRLGKMNEDELKEMFARNQEQLKERIAEEKLRQAQELLEEIMKEFPKSKAAKHASRMLQVHLQNFFPDFDAAAADPIADPGPDQPAKRDAFGAPRNEK